MNKAGVCSGRELREMFEAATTWLEKSVPEIDAMNVFPVPDGDTGTNMLLTLRATLEEAYRAPDHSATGVAQAMTHGALMGARGNSGVILSQIFRGLAQGLHDSESFGGSEFALALSKGSDAAYKALTHPVEGTILTVIKEASRAAYAASLQNDDLEFILQTAVEAARDSVANTPSLLPVLREAGVVDAGGQGLYTILDGMLHYVKGDLERMEYLQPHIVASRELLQTNLPTLSAEDEEPYGYCTEFLIEGEELNLDKIRKRLKGKGQCLIVVGDEHLIHIHIHTLDPGAVLKYGSSQGILHGIKIDNMDDQHKEFRRSSQGKVSTAPIAVVTVASGKGITEVFRSLGAEVVPGGQTMNPSAVELLEVVERVPQDEVILLPNNKNIVPTAQQALGLTSKKVRVVATETVPQGIAALFALRYDDDLESNVSAMAEAISMITTVEVTRAVRTTQIGGVKVRKKQPIGLVDGRLAVAGDTTSQALQDVLRGMDLEGKEVLTIYYGNGIKETEAEEVTEQIRQSYPYLQVELVFGGQPHYHYVVAVE